MLETKVILSSVTNLSDARYAAGMGVNYIGFIINPEKPGFVTPEDGKAISEWLSGVTFIGEVGTSNVDFSNYQVDYIQINTPELVDNYDEPILELSVDRSTIDSIASIISNYDDQIAFFILKIKALEWPELRESIAEICPKYACYISTDFTKVELREVLDCQPEGIVIYGSNELKPGLSNYDGIADVLEQLELD